jgi:hypothetical protein
MKNFLAGTLLVFSTLPAMAAPTAYQCKYEGHTGRNNVQNSVIYVIDAEAGTAMAYDGLIHQTNKVPIPTSFKVLQPGKYLLTWKLDNIPSKRGNISLTATFTARVNTGKMSSTIDTRIHRADNDIRGSGPCTVLRQ